MEESKIILNRRVVIVGGSAGSLNALLEILPDVTVFQSFALVIVLHRRGTDDLTLEELIKLKAQAPVKIIEDKVPIDPGFIYVAPSNYHLLFEKNNLFALDTSEKVNYSRPSIDVSFESAAEVYGSNLIGILFSGSNTDGTEGLKAIQNAGGVTIIQDPKSAEMPYMPSNAILNMTPDYILKNEEILKFILSIDK
ncbi:chemotaxis protein CheB [Flavobacterium sp. N1736]|uniref:chemotaxis protein CheB n=1 Tax=Flavobacterium sp. N1736 TaxID=2986823 RepID=UPI002224B0D3|nr:chemotaxis protein CheB [Flavobacterium sp. N1736]